MLAVLILMGVSALHLQKTHNNQHTATSSGRTASTHSGQFTNAVGHFSVSYPKDWQLLSGDSDQTARLRSPRGTVLHIAAIATQPSTNCLPDFGDVPYNPTNACPTQEYLSSEPTRITNLFYNKNLETGRAGGLYLPATVLLVTAHYQSASGTPAYLIGLTSSNGSNAIVLQKPKMGSFDGELSFSGTDATGSKHSGVIKAYASSSDPAFLNSSDARSVKAILQTLIVKL